MIDLENQEREIINLMFSQGISWLTAVRIRHKLSLAEVSKMLGISINSLKQIEKTERLSSNIKRKCTIHNKRKKRKIKWKMIGQKGKLTAINY